MAAETLSKWGRDCVCVCCPGCGTHVLIPKHLRKLACPCGRILRLAGPKESTK